MSRRFNDGYDGGRSSYNSYGRNGGRAYNNDGRRSLDRTSLQLFVGNVPVPCLHGELREFLNTAMRQGGLKIAAQLPGEAVSNVRVNNRFAFAEFATADECSLGLNLNGIKFKGHCLNITRPKKYRGPATQAVSWHDWVNKKMQENPSLKNNVVGLTSAEEHQQFLAAERMNKGYTPGSQSGGRYDSNWTSSGGGIRQSQHPPDNYRLYVGNCPMGIQSGTLSSFFSEAMMNANLTTSQGNPIVQCNVTNKNFAFITFRSVEEATNAMNMTGIPFMGKELSLGRPRGYVGPQNESFATWKTLLQTNFDVEKAKLFANSIKSLKMQHHTFVDMTQVPDGVKIGLLAGEPSKAIEISNLKDVQDIKAGLEEECSRFGNVSSIDVNGTTGVVRVEFASLFDAASALLGMHGRTLDGKQITIKYVR